MSVRTMLDRINNALERSTMKKAILRFLDDNDGLVFCSGLVLFIILLAIV